MTTYRIDAVTGRLQQTATQNLGVDVHALSGEPQGRYVYLAYGGWYDSVGSDGVIVAYAPEAQDGSLVQVSQATVWHEPAPSSCGWCMDNGAWEWLSASASRVFALWLNNWGTAGRHSTL